VAGAPTETRGGDGSDPNYDHEATSPCESQRATGASRVITGNAHSLTNPPVGRPADPPRASCARFPANETLLSMLPPRDARGPPNRDRSDWDDPGRRGRRTGHHEAPDVSASVLWGAQGRTYRLSVRSGTGRTRSARRIVQGTSGRGRKGRGLDSDRCQHDLAIMETSGEAGGAARRSLPTEDEGPTIRTTPNHRSCPMRPAPHARNCSGSPGLSGRPVARGEGRWGA